MAQVAKKTVRRVKWITCDAYNDDPKRLMGKMDMPQSQEDRAAVLRRVASQFLDEKQIEPLRETAGAGMRAKPNEE